MANIIDRRLNPKDKQIKNRQKFVQRSREQIKKAVKESIDSGNIADIEDGKAKIKVKGISEPTFGTDPKTGDKKYVMPGNKEFVQGDKQDKPPEEEGGSGTAGGLGTSEDEFEFVLNPEEYLNFIFDDLELPDLIKKQMKDVTKVKPKRAGFSNAGNPAQLDVVRSLKNSMGRRIGLNRPKKKEIEELEAELAEAIINNDKNEDINLAKGLGLVIVELQNKIDALKRRMHAVPWMDPFDIRYRAFTMQPQPMTKAVMFCVMDVSGSMGLREKDLAKRFFFFLHMFLRRKYEKVEIIFIKHHETAYEVSEDDFFHSKDSGGTVVSGALQLTTDILKARYNLNDWNIYVAQASDGDNYAADNAPTLNCMHDLLPLVQYFAYVEIGRAYGMNHATDLWDTYQHLREEYAQLNMRVVQDKKDIWKVFKELFSKEH
jgi:uncharacterized sporulation protein YeaH/YhbH (DUF444 family)